MNFVLPSSWKNQYATTTTESLPSKEQAIIYLRVSGEQQKREWHGLDSQKARCEKRAKDNDVDIVAEFRDEAISGSKDKRPWLMDAIKFIKTKNRNGPRVHFLVSTEISRISRPEHLDEGFAILSEVWKNHAGIVDASSGTVVDRGDDLNVIFSLFKLSQAKAERENGIQRANNGRIARLQSGYWPFSHAPIGYQIWREKVDGKSNVIVLQDQENAPILAGVLQRFAKGLIPDKPWLIAELKKNGFMQGKWRKNYRNHASLADRILNIERLYFYGGYILRGDYGIVEPIKAKHKPIITKEELERIVYKVYYADANPIKAKRWTDGHFALRGVVRCRGCDRRLTGALSKGKRKYYAYYYCNNKNCEEYHQNIPEKKLHEDVYLALFNLGMYKPTIELAKNIFVKNLDDEAAMKEAREVQYNKEIKHLNDQMLSISEVMLSVRSASLIDTYQKKYAALEKQVDKLKAERTMGDSRKMKVEHLEMLLDILQRPHKYWENQDDEFKKTLLICLFDDKLYYTKKWGIWTPQDLWLKQVKPQDATGVSPKKWVNWETSRTLLDRQFSTRENERNKLTDAMTFSSSQGSIMNKKSNSVY